MFFLFIFLSMVNDKFISGCEVDFEVYNELDPIVLFIKILLSYYGLNLSTLFKENYK